MLHIRKLVVLSHWRKKYIFWLIGCIILIYLCSPLINSLSLWQWDTINTVFQHQITEIVWMLFLLYFGSTILGQWKSNKIFQLLWAKKQEPISIIFQIRLGLYSIYSLYIIVTYCIGYIIQWFEINILLMYINLLISWWILLSLVMILSQFTNSYAAIIWSLILYVISYSINFILFSTPIWFQDSLSYQILHTIQYIFPRLDLLYSTMGSASWIRSAMANILYLIVIIILLIRSFLFYYTKK